jgi:hypothetical protein
MVTAAQRAAKAAIDAVAEDPGSQPAPLVLGVKLDDPFPKSLVGLLPRTSKRPAMEYVGHGAVTRRLLDVDPNWTWEPMGYGPDGTAAVERDQHGRPIGLWIKLTVNGVTRPGYGDCESGQFSAMKVLIGDALRNAAMRFGVALDLWVRGQAEDDEQFQGVTEEPPAPVDPVVEENMERYRAIMNRAMDLRAKDEAHIVGLRARATAAGFRSVNDWGKAHVDEFEEAVAGLEAVVAQEASGEPEREGTDG